jgi:hypothetical protein
VLVTLITYDGKNKAYSSEDDSEKSPAAAKNGKDTYDQRNDLACIGAGLNRGLSIRVIVLHIGIISLSLVRSLS